MRIRRSVRASQRQAIIITTAIQPELLEARQFLSASPLHSVNAAYVGPTSAVYAAASTTLPVPEVVSPGSSTSPGPVLTTLTPTFTWKAVTSATFTGYQLHVINLATKAITSYSIGHSATSFTLPTPLSAGVQYVWNLRVENGNATGSPGTYLYFQAPPVAVLPAPSVVSPGSTSSPGPVLTTLTPTFTWHAVTSAAFTGYQLNLENLTTNTFTSFQISKTATSFTVPTALPAGDKFVWNLRLVNGSATGSPSTYLYFQTAPATQSVPEVISPGSSVSPGPVLTTSTPTFTWKAFTGATFTGYQLHLINLTTNVLVSYSIGKTATSFTLPTALTAGDQYVWNLRIENGNTTGLPGTYLYFQAPHAAVLPAPSVISPGTTASPGPVLTTLSPTFTWHAVTSTTSFTGYQLNLENLTTNTFTSFQIGKTATSFSIPTALPAGDAFVWNLRLVNGTTTGAPSAYLYFQTPPAQTLPAPSVVSPGTTTSPGPVLTTSSPTFTWHAVTNVTFTGYQLNLENLTTNTFSSFQISKTATSFTPSTPLAAGDQYVWNLRLVNGTVTGSPSTYLYFQTPAAVLPAPVVIGPGSTATPGPVVTTTKPTFTWHAVTSVKFDSYQLNLYDETLGKFISFQISPTATSFTPPAGDLAAGDTFVWNLRLRVGSTTGPESAYLYFQTA